LSPSPQVAWIWILLAGCVEVVWLVCSKYTDGFTKLLPTMLTVSLMGVSMVLMAQAIRVIPMGTAYAVWTGIGAAGGALAGILLFGESANPVRLGCIALIIAGIVGLKLLPSQ
jgi:quaternary ammonium compound-resistance protein SugE